MKGHNPSRSGLSVKQEFKKTAAIDEELVRVN
jgi:hypothetical protein